MPSSWRHAFACLEYMTISIYMYNIQVYIYPSIYTLMYKCICMYAHIYVYFLCGATNTVAKPTAFQTDAAARLHWTGRPLFFLRGVPTDMRTSRFVSVPCSIVCMYTYKDMHFAWIAKRPQKKWEFRNLKQSRNTPKGITHECAHTYTTRTHKQMPRTWGRPTGTKFPFGFFCFCPTKDIYCHCVSSTFLPFICIHFFSSVDWKDFYTKQTKHVG